MQAWEIPQANRVSQDCHVNMNIATFTAKPWEVVIQTGTVQSQEYDGNTTKLKYMFLATNTTSSGNDS